MEKLRLIDTPIEKQEYESLGVGMYADVLSRFIMGCETPITIGIQGDWGIGKTSLLNMVKENLEPRKGRMTRYHTIYFNTWQYSQFHQEEFLGLSILKGIMREIQSLPTLRDAQKNENLKKVISGFNKFITNLGNQVIKNQTGLDFKEAKDGLDSSCELDLLSQDLVVYLRQMKGEFAALVKALIVNENDRLIIMVDDLDRIKPLRALEFLESIKNFLDVEHCVFVMAVDYSVIQSGMVEKLGRTAQELQGKSYFDKIIQVPFSMPVNSYRTDRYIMSLLGWEFCQKENRYIQNEMDRDRFYLAVRAKVIEKEDVDFFTNITGLTVGKNPRSIKRSINYANLLRLVVQAKRTGKNQEWTLRDAKLLYPMACMQLAWPELFYHFSHRPLPSTLHLMQDFEFLTNLQGMDGLFNRVHNPDETKSNITGFIDELVSLVDRDGNGEINSEEFKPLWSMMNEANLTSVAYRDIQDDWEMIEKLILSNCGKGNHGPRVKRVINLLSAPELVINDPSRFHLLSAGKKFYNLIWNGNQVGSFVTTCKEPIQFYVKTDYECFFEKLPESLKIYVEDVRGVGHFGAGNTKIKIEAIANSGNSTTILNNILESTLNNLSIKF